MPDAATHSKVESYLQVVINTFGEGADEAQEAFALIAEQVRSNSAALAFRLLAMRRYLRMGERKVVAQWAWTAEQTQMQMTSGEAKTMYDLAARVRQIFAQQNPGYQLLISPLRSLERQVELWVVNQRVQAAGERLLTDMSQLLGGSEYPATPNAHSARRFRVALRNARVQPEPTSAAPGTSDHGQGHAVDFVVARAGGTPIATTKTAQIRTRWKRDGWEERLMRAIDACNQEQLSKPLRPAPILDGPLQKPYEPWHWVLKYSGAAA